MSNIDLDNVNVNDVLSFVATTEFKPFNENDWEAFAGCDSKNPLIGYTNNMTIVIDGDIVNVIPDDDEFGGYVFRLTLTEW
jgi:hypothetical protein